MDLRRELVKGSIDSLLLCLLARQSMYGYQIIKELEHQSLGYFKFKEGTLYPALHRLESACLIVGSWETLESGRQRKYYKITEKGLEMLGERTGEWQEFLTAMSFFIKPSTA